MIVKVYKKNDVISYNIDNYIDILKNDANDIFAEITNGLDVEVVGKISSYTKPTPQFSIKYKKTISKQSVLDLNIEQTNKSIDNLINLIKDKDYRIDEQILVNDLFVNKTDKYYTSYTKNIFKKGAFSSAFSSAYSI